MSSKILKVLATILLSICILGGFGFLMACMILQQIGFGFIYLAAFLFSGWLCYSVICGIAHIIDQNDRIIKILIPEKNAATTPLRPYLAKNPTESPKTITDPEAVAAQMAEKMNIKR